MDIFSYVFLEPYIQILVALILGAVLGIERNFVGKTAGMRTYSLVSMSACLFVLISVEAGLSLPAQSFTPMQVVAGIITGIGFLGAGLIIFKDSKLIGLTTAAGLWVAAGIGIAVGYKLYGLAVFATLITLFNFTILWRIEHRLTKIADNKQVPPGFRGQ